MYKKVNINNFMKIAIEEAEKGIKCGHGGPFGAVVVKNGEIVGKGHNKVISNNDPTCHGEVDAIRNACKKLKTFDLSGCDIYSTSYPCPMCFCAILWANINKIYYGCNTTDAENIGFRDKAFEENTPKNKLEKCIEINRPECLQLFEKYNNMEDKKIY